MPCPYTTLCLRTKQLFLSSITSIPAREPLCYMTKIFEIHLFSVHFSGVELLACELIRRRAKIAGARFQRKRSPIIPLTKGDLNLNKLRMTETG
jgi:hypothetical protein